MAQCEKLTCNIQLWLVSIEISGENKTFAIKNVAIKSEQMHIDKSQFLLYLEFQPNDQNILIN